MTQTESPPAQVPIHRNMEKIIRHMLENPRTAICGADIGRALGLSSGTITPIMKKMLAAGWLDAETEPRRPGATGPLRVMYRFTQGTAAMLRKAVED